ncbi:VPA1350 family putative T3SS effector [Vibrio parahaemolyticus]|nr:VPA1350 family putative T3SS effector [Vibrio parahaemolyticus]EIK4811181.1 VPA1350 family putative T3SS effector [Vibrio parahaemolyticus]EJC1211723.1 VPA1350 family putative T3SS effector [Vibrio parahaemolyticus]EJG1998012.1 VPA1350 family putative T3SS effector [Vibrio parahaemolyticus]MBM4959807.1 VPA1350 family putative T3SS effector [Vibrio parahaemolyticus]
MTMQNMTVNSTFGVGSIATTDRQSAAQQLAEQYPIVKKAQAEVTLTQARLNTKDPLDLIDELLSKYLGEQTERAESMADTIKVRSDAIAEISRLWGLVMQDNMNHTNPNDNGVKTPLGDTTESAEYLTKIDKIIKEQLKDDRGISAITGKDLANSKSYQVSYTDLQSLDATVTAFNDTIQVEIDTEQQRFKNVMTEISSAQEEIRDVRQVIVRLSQAS